MKQLKYIVTTTFADEYILFASNLKELVDQVDKLKSKYNIYNDEIVSIKEGEMTTKIVSNDCCDYKIDNNQLIYNDFKGTGNDTWGEVQLFEHFSKGDIAYMKKEFGQDFRVWCSQFGDCTEQLIDTDELVEFKEVV